jgi:hypothetical protein
MLLSNTQNMRDTKYALSIMMLFSRTRVPGSLHNIQLHCLAVWRQVHHLLMSLKYSYKIICNFIRSLSLLHLKAKGYIFIIKLKYWLSTMVVVNLGWWTVGSCYDICGWWSSHYSWKVHLGLIINVPSDSSVINNGEL